MTLVSFFLSSLYVLVYCLLLGDMYETGADKGKYYSINVPLKDGIDDQSELCTETLYYN